MSDRPPCAVEPPNCCVKTIGFLSPCPKCGHMHCHGRYLEWEASRDIVRPHPGCAGIDECCCLDRHDPWAPDSSFPDGVAYVMRVGPLRCRVSDAVDGDWEWAVTVAADHETAWISSGFAVGKDAAMRRAEQAIKLIADGVARALTIAKRHSVALCGTCGVRLSAGTGIQCSNCGDILRVRWSEA